jgi:hypothetical protein
MIFGTAFQRILLITLAIFATSAFWVAWWRTSANFSLTAAPVWVLVGGVTDTSATFRIRVGRVHHDDDGATTTLTISTMANFENPVFIEVIGTANNDDTAVVVDEAGVAAVNSRPIRNTTTRSSCRSRTTKEGIRRAAATEQLHY